MLSREEMEFVEFWAENRLKKKKIINQLSVGFPLGVVLVIAIFLNFFSGWDKRADMALYKEKSSLILVLLVAAILIVLFVVIFSAHYRWDQNEQHYKELLIRKDNK